MEAIMSIFCFHPYLWKIPILTHIVQMGWFNHHNYSFFFSKVYWRYMEDSKICKGFQFLHQKSNPPQSLSPKNMDLKITNPQAMLQRSAEVLWLIISPPGKKKTNLPEVAFRYALLGGGFRYFLFSSPFGEDFQFD